MRARKISKIEYLFRQVRESDQMEGWDDRLARLEQSVYKQLSLQQPEEEMQMSEK